MRATATARPTAAETKFWTVRPTVWTSGDVPASPAYDCQLVLVTNETAVLTRGVDVHPSAPLAQRQRALRDDHERTAARCPTTEKATTDDGVGASSRCSESGSTPTSAVDEPLDAPVPCRR